MGDYLGPVLVVAAYFCGSIPFGLLLGRKRGVDVREMGSGNIGATNVARNLGKKLGALVLLLDALKAALPTLVGRVLVSRGELEIEYWAAIALAAVVGHCYPVWLRFKGGKGVACALGVFLVVDPALAGIGFLIFASMYGAFKMASVGSVSTAVAFPVLQWLFGRPVALVYLGIAIAAIIIVKHRENLKRLFSGTENKV